MRSMFYKSKATSIDLSSFDVSNVTEMERMFMYSGARLLDLSSFDTAKQGYITMSYMFFGSSIRTGYARTQADADRFNESLYIPTGLKFIVKP